MRTTIIFLILPVFLLSQQLEIPEITVYGERQIIVEPIEKQLLPFEKELSSPTYESKKAALPSIKEERLVEVKRNFGFIARADAGSKYEGYLIGYLRNYYYPLQVGISGIKNSNIVDDFFNVFSRMSYNNLYFNAGYVQRNNSTKISYLYISGYFQAFSGCFELAYTDSLFADANIDLSTIPFYFEIDIDDNLKEETPVDFRSRKVFSISSEKIFWGDGVLISPEGRRIMNKMASFLNEVPSHVVISENGPAIKEGTEQLGLSRAWAVIKYLTIDKNLDKNWFGVSAGSTFDRGDIGSGELNRTSLKSKRTLEIVLLRSIYD